MTIALMLIAISMGHIPNDKGMAAVLVYGAIFDGILLASLLVWMFP